jgi:uncharacterized membrane protein YgdD (TMEM256/DUF423 family)
MERNSFFENISELRENFTLYSEAKLSLFTLKGIEKAVKAATTIIGHTTAIIFTVVSVLFFSTAAALYLGRIFDNLELGLVAVASFYLLLGIVFFSLKKAILSGMILRFLVNLIFHDDDDHHEKK